MNAVALLKLTKSACRNDKIKFANKRLENVRCTMKYHVVPRTRVRTIIAYPPRRLTMYWINYWK